MKIRIPLKKKPPVAADVVAEDQKPIRYCSRCGGLKIANWHLDACADVFCKGVYVTTGEDESNKQSIRPMPEKGFWGGARRRMLCRLNN